MILLQKGNCLIAVAVLIQRECFLTLIYQMPASLRKVTALTLVDLSAAFDKIDHLILL